MENLIEEYIREYKGEFSHAKVMYFYCGRIDKQKANIEEFGHFYKQVRDTLQPDYFDLDAERIWKKIEKSQ